MRGRAIPFRQCKTGYNLRHMSRAIPFRTPVTLLVAACFLAFVVGQGPHLVHHLFESHAECAFASGAERAEGVPDDFVTPIPEPQAETCAAFADQTALPRLTLVPADARAPPLLAS